MGEAGVLAGPGLERPQPAAPENESPIDTANQVDLRRIAALA